MTGHPAKRPNRAVAVRLLDGDPTQVAAGARRANVLSRIEAGRRRTVQVDVEGQIDRAMADRMARRIEGDPGLTHITVYVNSPGGEDAAGFRMYQALRRSGAVIRAIAGDRCHSSALWPFLSGDVRQCRSSTTFMVHRAARDQSPGIVRRGTAEEYTAIAASLAAADRRFLDVLCSRTGAPREKMQREMAHERPMNAGSAFSAGIVHEVGAIVRLDPSLPGRLAAMKASGRSFVLGVPSVKFGASYQAACQAAALIRPSHGR